MDVFDLYAKISLDSKGYEKGLTSAKGSFDKFKVNIGDTLKAVAKITVAAVSAGAAATGKIVKDAGSNYGEYEQLVGGVDTLFKESSQKVQNYADKAFSSVQISANEYMSTVTEFSAALIQSLNGDTNKAADAANRALVDMADNWNKMGSDAESIKNAYRGFSKGNWMMLDNLKLGYGGTAKEMKRLLDDAAKVDSQFKKTAKYTMDEKGHLEVGFATVVDAIHIVQKQMGITGTSAEEASTTIQGSMASVKAAWQDTLTAIGSGKDIDKKLDNFTRSVKKYGENMKPVIKQALSGAVKVIGELAPDVAAELPKLVTELAPDVLKAGADIVTNLATGVLNELDRSNFDKTAGKLTEKVNKIIDGFDAEKSGERFSGVINKFINAGFNIASTFDFKKAAEKMTTWLNKAVKNLDTAKLGQTVSDVWKGVWDFIGTALEEVDWKNVGAKISEFINNINWSGILDSMFKVIGGVIKAMPELLKGVIKNLDFESAANAMAVLFAPKAATKLFNFFKTDSATKKTLENAGGEAGGKVSGGLLGKFSNAGSGIIGKVSSGLQTASVLASAFSIGWTIGTQIKKGLDDIGWGQWIDDKVNKLMDIVNVAEKVKAIDTESKANAQKHLARLKKSGIDWLSLEDVETGNGAYQLATTIYEMLKKYPQLAKAGYSAKYLSNLYAYDREKFHKLRNGDLSVVGIKPATPTPYKPSTPAEQLENQRIEDEIRRIRANWKGGPMPDEATLRKMAMGNLGMISSTLSSAMSATNIYLDTGKLVGGTSRTSATQNNYAMRGYAT